LLEQNPERWPLAPETGELSLELREMLYGLGRHKTNRAVFEIRQQEVIVYAIRHLAQDRLSAGDIEN
jgi:hypothetical protein